jgi:site-specific recombinase XerD
VEASLRLEKVVRRMNFSDYPLPKWLTEALAFYLLFIRPSINSDENEEALLLHSRTGKAITHDQMKNAVKYIFHKVGTPTKIKVF